MRVVVFAMLVLTAGCEGQVIFHGTITIAPEIAPTDGARILLVINDDYRYPTETIEGMWETREGGLYVLEPAAEHDAEEHRLTGEVVTRAGVTEYEYWHGEFAYYPKEVWLGAFVDEDGNGAPDPGEPWGPSPANPLHDLPFNAPPEDPFEVDMTIDRVWE